VDGANGENESQAQGIFTQNNVDVKYPQTTETEKSHTIMTVIEPHHTVLFRRTDTLCYGNALMDELKIGFVGSFECFVKG
jgi:hypothetical protein